MSSDSLEVTIGGHTLCIRGHDSADLREHVAMVNRSLEEISGKNGEVNVRVALLAALNIAEALSAERRSHVHLLEVIRERAARIAETIERIPR